MNKQPQQRSRVFIFGVIIIVFYLVLALRLADLQLADSEEFKDSIATQSIRRVRIPAVRGRIFSSDGKIVADNKVFYNAVFHLAEMRKAGRGSNSINFIYSWAQRLAKAIRRPLKVTKKDILHQMYMKPAIPITIFKNLNPRELAICEEFTPPIPGMEIVSMPVRYYPYGEVGCHFLGYTGMDDPGEAPDRNEYNYYVPDVKGRAGIEKMIDKHIDLGAGFRGLRGEAGSKLLRVNVKGYVHDDLGVSIAPRNGNDVVLTIDWKAQEAAAQALKEVSGSLVCLNADTGAVVAMVSSPGFDPNDFTGGISSKKWNELLHDPKRPLFDRPLMGAYMPGSIAKPLIALAALKDGINPNATVYCDGFAKIGNSGIHCWIWRYGGHGYENMEDAIRDSCNVYFVDTGLKLGLPKIKAMLKAAGVGRDTGIGLPERSGVLPSVAAKKRAFGTKWRAFDTGLISIGQGIFTITPIQAAVYCAAIANGGTVYRPYLIKEVKNYNDKVLYKTFPHEVDRLPVSENDIKVIQQGMYKGVNDPIGGSKRAKNEYIVLSGKTGTAQVGSPPNRYLNTWFIGFGKYEGTNYAICVQVEHGRAGGTTNAPIAKKFFELWLGGAEDQY